MDKIILTDLCKKVLAYLQEFDETWVGKDLGEKTEVKGIYAVLTSLVNKGLVSQNGSIVRDFTNIKGETKPKEYKTYVLTDAGRAYSL